MKNSIIVIIFFSIGTIAFGQTNSPKEITIDILKKINAEVELQIPKFKEKLLKKDFNSEEIEFSVDTFRIMKVLSKRMNIDYSTAGMNRSVSEMTDCYDKLLNKYYNKLMKLLQPEDKKTLLATQKAWIVFRDAETDFIGTITKDIYSGGGTIQSNIRVGAYSDIVVKRTNEIFLYYNGAIENLKAGH